MAWVLGTLAFELIIYSHLMLEWEPSFNVIFLIPLIY